MLFPSLGRKDAATARALGRGRTGGLSAGLRTGEGLDPEAQIKRRFDRGVWAFRAIDAIATNQLKLRMVVREGDDPFDGEEVAGHRLTRLLNGRPNAYEEAAAFRYRLSALFLASNRGAFVEWVPSNLGNPLALHILPVHKTKPVPPKNPREVEGLRAFVDHFEVKLDAGQTDRLPPEEVLWLRKPHPLDPYRSITPLEQAGLSIDVAQLARIFARNYLGNDGRGAALVAFEEAMEDDVIDAMDARFNGGTSRAGRTTIVDKTKEVFVHEFGGEPGEWTGDQADDARDETLVAFGVPLSVIGKATDSTFSNADADLLAFWREAMMGHLRFVSAAFDPLLAGEREDRVIGWDLSNVEVLQKDKREQARFSLEEFNSGALTLDQYLEATGREPVGGDVGGSRFMPMARIPVGLGGTRQREGTTASAQGAKSGDRDDDDPERAGAKDAADADPWFELRDAAAQRFEVWEVAVHDVAARWFARVASVVDERLRGKQGRKGTRHWDPPGTKQVDPSRVFPTERFRGELTADMREVLERLYDDVGSDVALHLEAAPFNVHDPGVTASLNTRANRLSRVVDTTWEQVRDAIAAGELEGEPIDDIADRVQQTLSRASRVRARTIARTEVVSAANDAALQAATQAGGVATKTWLTSRDGRVRGGGEDAYSHVVMDGVSVPVDAAFEVQGDLLQYPGDPSGSAGNVINCRCTLLYGRGA